MWRFLVLALLGGALAFPSARAEEFCFECHGDPDLARDGVRIVDRDAYASGVHAGLDCTDCHEAAQADGFEIVPHRMTEGGPPTCLDCHDDFETLEAQVAASVHAGLKAFDCTSCHDPHAMRGDRDELDRGRRVPMANHACVRCHRDSVFRVVGRRDGSPPVSTHEWLPSLEKHARMRCVVCHTPMGREDVHNIVPKEEATRACDACHGVNAPMVEAHVPPPPTDRAGWVTNPLVFQEAYVPGTTTNRVVDAWILALLGLTVLGVLVHGALRIVTRRAEGPHEIAKTYLYGTSTRLWHWANAAFFLVLALTGLRIHFGGPDEPLLTFETAFNVHNLTGAAFVFVGVFFFVSNAVSGNARNYLRFAPRFVRGVFQQARWYLYGIFRGEPHPHHPSTERKFNPLQQLTYAGLMYVLFPILILTGVVLLFPSVLPVRIAGRPGTFWFATAHYLTAMASILFLVAHVYLATMGDRVGYLLQGMITGWHKHHVPRQGGTGRDQAP